jgi:hypothetical protein
MCLEQVPSSAGQILCETAPRGQMLGSGPRARSPHQIWPPEPDAETAPRRPDPAQDRASTAGSRDLGRLGI